MSQLDASSNKSSHELYMGASEVKKEVLPPKKRYGNFFIEGGHLKSNEVIMAENITHQEKKSILTGVIRHTSCPDHSVAYF